MFNYFHRGLIVSNIKLLQDSSEHHGLHHLRLIPPKPDDKMANLLCKFPVWEDVLTSLSTEGEHVHPGLIKAFKGATNVAPLVGLGLYLEVYTSV